MKKLFILFFLLGSICSFSQRQMENLGRGLVAQKVNSGMYINWRITGQEWYGTSYNLYRDGVKLNDIPIAGASNFTDPGGTTQSVYTVTAVKNKMESMHSKPAIVVADRYLNIPLRELNVNGYEPNDATMADLDGDGEMEIIVKRVYGDWTADCLHYSYFEAYKLNGTFLWAINVGPNITDDVETNIAAFDFDGDGKAEVFMRTSEGTVFGDGMQIGDTNADGKINYRQGGYMIEGPEFLSLIDGETGKELDRVDYIPRTFGGKTVEQIWGDGYGHRASKYFFGAPYLDGKKPSLFIGRGIYTRTVMRTYDIVNKKLVFKWEFNTDENPAYFGQGFHNYSVADVDGDGCDEIVWGSMVVNNDGKGLYSTGLGHGDAHHVGDFDPYNKGLEIWTCHENTTGVTLREAGSGKILIRRITGRDTGRSMAANVTNDFLGAALGGGPLLYSATTRSAVKDQGGMTSNFRIYWDGDLLEECFDYDRFSDVTGGGEGAVYKWGKGRIFTTSGALTNNWTKGTPCMQADILGDWREEIIMRSADNKSLRIYMTTDPTEHRFYTLLHDMQYRQAICWQMCGYNQPPHTSFFLGDVEGITMPPPPVLTNDKLVYCGDGSWGASWTKNGIAVSYSDGQSVLFDADNGGTVTLSGTVSPELLTVNSKGDYILKNGSFAGAMQLNKQGPGTLTLSGALLHTGSTELWDGLTILTSDVENSPVWMNRFAELNLKSNAKKGIIQEYGSILRIGSNDEKATATVSDSLYLKWGARVDFDIYDSDFTADLLKVNGNLVLTKDAVFHFTAHLSNAKIKAGEYLLAEVSGVVKGEVTDLEIRGMEGVACSLSLRDGKIYLSVADTRDPGSVVWNGTNEGGEWNLASTRNFLNENTEDFFVTDDQVLMNDAAASKNVTVTSNVSPFSLLVDATSNYKIMGNKSIGGEGTFTKRGSGTLTIENTNSFTGKVELLGGTVSVSSMASTSFPTGSLGSLKTKASDFIIDGAILQAYNEDVITSSSPMMIGENGATFNTVGDMRLEGAMSGIGKLTKTGSLQLAVCSPGNTYTGGTEVKAGTLAMGDYNSTFGKRGSPLIISGGTVQIFDINNTTAVPDFNYAVTIPTGSNVNLNAGARCAIKGSFSGSGTLNLFIPYVRTDMYANWSGYTGKLNVTGGDFRLVQDIDMSGTALALGNEVYMGHFRAGSGNALSATSKIGSLASDYATATLVNGTYNVGYNNTAAIFKGLLSGVTVNKYGTGNWTLTNQNSATLNIYGGKVLANASSGATNSGTTNVRSGGTLAGTGSVKNLNVYEGGTLEAASSTVLVGKFTINGNLALNKGKLYIKRRSRRNDNLVVNGNVSMTHAVIEVNASTALSDGDELTVVTASGRISGTFSVSPAVPGPGLRWNTEEFLSSGVLKVEIDPTDGLHSIGADAPRVYPTAVKDVCHVDVSAACQGMVKLELFDASGKIVLGCSFDASEPQTVDMSGCQTGIYFMVLRFGDDKAQVTLTKL